MVKTYRERNGLDAFGAGGCKIYSDRNGKCGVFEGMFAMSINLLVDFCPNATLFVSRQNKPSIIQTARTSSPTPDVE